MSHRARLYVLVLGLASCAAWVTGVVLLPLAVWLAAELAITLGERATQRA
jgi:hypothetical protein